MDTTVEQYINNTFPDQVVICFNKAFSIFSLVGLSDYQEPYISFLMLEDTVDKNDLRDSFYQKLFSQILEILEEHEITINDNASISELLDVLEFVITVEKYKTDILESIQNYIASYSSFITIRKKITVSFYRLLKEKLKQIPIKFDNFN